MKQSDFNQLIRLIVIAFEYHGENHFQIKQLIIQAEKSAISENHELVIRALEGDELNEREKIEVIDTTFITWLEDQFNPNLSYLVKEYSYPPQLAEKFETLRHVIRSRGL